jgi:hypothetical protein
LVVDADENIPLNKAVLIDKPEEFTDLDDQELFFNLDIKNVLDAHNEYRQTVIDKKASKNKDKDIMLEPIRIRDLKMAVLTIMDF